MPGSLRTMSAAGASPGVGIDIHAFPGAGVGLVVSITGTLTASVQVSGANSASARWVDHDTLVNLTANALGNIAFPVMGVRLNVTNYTNGTANLDVVQSEPGAR